MSKREKERIVEVYAILDKGITDRSDDMAMQLATAVCDAHYKLLALMKGWDDESED